ncbi:MAG: tyrosine/phenylalanine carboxypeptidase domain-containing protein [Byssovorax sp.]
MKRSAARQDPQERTQRAPRWTARATQALTDASSQIRVIASNTPTNLREELDRLHASWRCAPEIPRFSYSAAPDHTTLRSALLGLADELDGLGELGSIYAGRARELEIEAAICEHAGGPGLWAAARIRYALRDGFEAVADATATKWLDEAGPRATRGAMSRSDDEHDPTSLVSRLRQELGRRRLPLRVLVSKNLASLAATGEGFVQVVAERALSKSDVERTVLHEIEGHVLPRHASSSAAIGIFTLGTARGSDDQEGRALSRERAAGFLDHGRRREIALRHQAARSVGAGADFVATARLLLDHGAALVDALRIAARDDRGGGLAREAVYLPALLRVEAALAVESALDDVLGAGRVSVDAASALRGWVARPSDERA